MPTPHYHINLFWSDEDQAFIADIPDLRFCSAHGPTPEIALREILAAQKAWLTSARKRRATLPKPRYRIPTPGEQLRAMTADFDGPIPPGKTRPLTRAERAKWNRAKRKRPGRKRYVSFKLDRALLNRADLLAHKRNLTRDQFITQLLKSALARSPLA